MSEKLSCVQLSEQYVAGYVIDRIILLIKEVDELERFGVSESGDMYLDVRLRKATVSLESWMRFGLQMMEDGPKEDLGWEW